MAGTPVQAIRFDPNGNGQPDDIRVQMDANPTNGLIGGASGACTEPNEDVTIAFDPALRAITVRDNATGGAAVPRTDAIVEGLAFVYRDAARAPTTNPTFSVTVLAKDCMSADAWATALTVMAPEAALAFATEHDLAALIISRGATGLEERLSPALRTMLD